MKIRFLALVGLLLLSLSVSVRAVLSVSDESRLQGLLGRWKVTEAGGRSLESGKTALTATQVSTGVVHLTWTYFQGSYQTQALIRCDTKTRTLQLLELSRDGSVAIFPGEFDRTNNLVFQIKRGNAPARLVFAWTGDTLTTQEYLDEGGTSQSRSLVKLVREPETP